MVDMVAEFLSNLGKPLGTINHKILISKLEHYGIRGYLYNGLNRI